MYSPWACCIPLRFATTRSFLLPHSGPSASISYVDGLNKETVASVTELTNVVAQKASFEQLVELMVKHDMKKVAVERAEEHIETNLAEYLEKGVVK